LSLDRVLGALGLRGVGGFVLRLGRAEQAAAGGQQRRTNGDIFLVASKGVSL